MEILIWKGLLSQISTMIKQNVTFSEKEMILKRYPYYKDDMIMLWDSLRKDGYTRSYASLVRVVNKWIKPEIKKKLH